MHPILNRGSSLGLLALASLAACSSQHAPAAAPGGEAVVTTPSISGTVATIKGSQKSLSIPFNASESTPIASLTVTAGLSSLPEGWSGPATFTCSNISTGNGCMLNLVFAPTGVTAGTLEIDYSYTTSDAAAHSGSLSIPYSSTSDDNVVGTASPAGQVVAMAGAGSQSVAVSFDTDDGAAATSLALTTDLTQLPPGWSSTRTTFTCANVSTGNGCQLPLTYAPTGADSGTLTLSYTYDNDSGASRTGTVAIPYSATSKNNVVATAAPSGQINAILGGGTQQVAITFTTDDGSPATGLSITSGLAPLPGDWTSTQSTFTCSNVDTGNGCQLTLSYAPSAVGTGTVQLGYVYTDNAGESKTGTVSVPYAATAHDVVTGTVAPSGQVNALVGGGTQSVTVTFNTDDGNVATGLTLTNPPGGLPNDWHTSASGFSCANVSTGNTCQLTLTYTPTAVNSGTIGFNFQYMDNAGAQQTGTVNIPYAATAHDNVTATVSPSGPLTVLVNDAAGVNVVFATDDGNEATQLEITQGLNSLPSGWSGPASFSCSGVSGNSVAACVLPLSYTPTSVASGTISLSYGYKDNAGSTKVGTVSIPYAAATHNHVLASVSPTTINPTVGNSQAVTVTFTTDDSNPASGLSMDLSSLPSEWSGPSSTFSCPSIGGGTACQLSLTYTPTSASLGSALSLPFSYVDNAGLTDTGAASVPYSATVLVQHAYASDGNGDGLVMCSINTDKTLANCAEQLPSQIWSVASVAFSGNWLYFADVVDNNVQVCTVAADGTVGNCQVTGSNYTNPLQLVVQGSKLYIENDTFNAAPVTHCDIDSGTGLLANCASTGTSAALGQGPYYSLTMSGSYAWEQNNNGHVVMCTVANDGTFGNCIDTGRTGLTGGDDVYANGGYLYILQSGGSVDVCPINNDGSLGTCANSALGSFSSEFGINISGAVAYIGETTYGTGFPPMPSNHMYVCAVSTADGSISNCVLSDGGLTWWAPYTAVVH